MNEQTIMAALVAILGASLASAFFLLRMFITKGFSVVKGNTDAINDLRLELARRPRTPTTRTQVSS